MVFQIPVCSRAELSQRSALVSPVFAPALPFSSHVRVVPFRWEGENAQPSRVHGLSTNCCGLTLADLTARGHLVVQIFEGFYTNDIDPVVIYLWTSY
jgi:hypothetical protein